MPRQALTDVQLAAMAAGVTLEISAPAPTTAPTPTPTPTIPTVPPTTPTVSPAVSLTENPAHASVLSYWQDQVAHLSRVGAQSAVELASANAKALLLEAEHVGLKAIVAQSLTTMKTALGLTLVDAAAFTVASLLAEHAATSRTFTQAFKTGGVAASGASGAHSGDSQAGPVDLAQHLARVAASRVQVPQK